MPTTPPTITPGPTAPQRGDKSTFSVRVDAFVTWLIAVVSQFAAVALNVYNNAVEAMGYSTAAGNSASTSAAMAEAAAASAQNSADSATAAAVTAGAGLWASGQTVQRDAAVISPTDRRTYRRKTATGSGTTDPSIDPTNYVLLSADASSYMLLSSATVGSATPLINFLTAFSDAYRGYVIDVEGLTTNEIESTLQIRLAIGGSANSENVYYYSNQSTGVNAASFGYSSPSGANFLIDIRGARGALNKWIGARGAGKGTVVRATSQDILFDKTSVVSGFQLLIQTGANFTGGTVRVYGVRA